MKYINDGIIIIMSGLYEMDLNIFNLNNSINDLVRPHPQHSNPYTYFTIHGIVISIMLNIFKIIDNKKYAIITV